MRKQAKHVLAGLLLVNVLIHFDPPELTLTMEPDSARPANPEAFVAAEACRFLQVQRVPLPVPYTLVWLTNQKEGAGRYLEQNGPKLRGLLTRCPEATGG